jgi:hypothetical protein
MTIVKTIAPAGCAHGACPALHLTDTGTVLIQGARLPVNPRTLLEVPDHEDVVAIPREVFEALLARYAQ